MDQQKLGQALDLIAGSIETGYSSVYTYAVKEMLSTPEKQKLATLIRRYSSEIKGIDQSPISPSNSPSSSLPTRH